MGREIDEIDRIEWVEVRRFDDPMQAEMTTQFLRDHGVTVRTRGNSGATAVLNRFTTVIDIRVDVPRAEAEQAVEALRAFEIGETIEAPFRGGTPAGAGGAGGALAEDAGPLPRKASTAIMLGLMVPIAGAHFYARHGAAGGILLAGVVASIIGIMAFGRIELAVAWAIIVVADVALAPAAVRRFNERRVPPESRQRLTALLVLLVAFAAAFAVHA